MCALCRGEALWHGMEPLVCPGLPRPGRGDRGHSHIACLAAPRMGTTPFTEKVRRVAGSSNILKL